MNSVLLRLKFSQKEQPESSDHCKTTRTHACKGTCIAISVIFVYDHNLGEPVFISQNSLQVTKFFQVYVVL